MLLEVASKKRYKLLEKVMLPDTKYLYFFNSLFAIQFHCKLAYWTYQT